MDTEDFEMWGTSVVSNNDLIKQDWSYGFRFLDDTMTFWVKSPNGFWEQTDDSILIEAIKKSFGLDKRKIDDFSTLEIKQVKGSLWNPETENKT